MLWVKKSWTMIELHLYVFKYIRGIMTEWVHWADPDTDREPKDGKRDLRKYLIEFPYRQKEDVPMTKAAFDALTDEEAFNLCCPGIVKNIDEEADEDFDILNTPY